MRAAGRAAVPIGLGLALAAIGPGDWSAAFAGNLGEGTTATVGHFIPTYRSGGGSGAIALLPTAPIRVGNALTLPAQRHVVRMTPDRGPAIWLLALQQDGMNGNGLSFFRSDDEGRSYGYCAAIQPDWTERDEADVVAVGSDVALVYSYEGPFLTGSLRHDVYFQWWRWQPGTRDYLPRPAVEVYASPSAGNAYSRAELAVDSEGVLWVQTFLMGSDGNTSSVEIAYSADGGATFQQLPTLDTLPQRGGGRLLALGSETVVVYAQQGGSVGTWMSLHRDADPPSAWSSPSLAFPDGIYHGAALSAVADGKGGMHLVFKKDADQNLYYAHFDGTAFGPASFLDDSADWALQPATTLVGDSLFVFYNHFVPSSAPASSVDSGHYDFRYRVLTGDGFTAPIVVDDAPDWKGYPAGPATLPGGLGEVPCFFGETPDANSSGNLMETIIPAGAGVSGGGEHRQRRDGRLDRRRQRRHGSPAVQ